MGKIAAITTLVLLLVIAGAASAETFTIELPELVGELEPYPNGSTAVFDFGTSFLSIDEVRIQASGTFTLGSAHGGGWDNPVDVWTDVHPTISIYMDLEPGFAGRDLSSFESPFVIELLDLVFGATWDSLLDGTEQLRAELSYGCFIDDWVIATWPTLQISEAHLTIEGVVPEPATVLLLAMGTVWVRAKCP